MMMLHPVSSFKLGSSAYVAPSKEAMEAIGITLCTILMKYPNDESIQEFQTIISKPGLCSLI